MVENMVVSVFESAEKLEAPSSDIVHRLILEHLLHNCYKEAAISFSNICQLSLGSSGHISTKSTSFSQSPTRTQNSSKASYYSNKKNLQFDTEGDLEMEDLDQDNTTIQKNDKTMTFISGVSHNDNPSIFSIMDERIHGAWQSLESRRMIMHLLLSGRISEAISLCNAKFPQVLNEISPESIDICFQLQCQQFIECVRRSAPEALQFAQEELGRFGMMNGKYLETLQDIVALIAYAEPDRSPAAGYLSQQRREEVANAVNSFILASDGIPSLTSIEKLAKHATILRDCLHLEKDKKSKTTSSTPRWSLNDFLADAT